MCIVSFFPTVEGFIFSSNRDEKQQRPTLEPKFYDHPSPLIYPKDMDHGGTWFAVDSIKRQLFCVLNATGVQPTTTEKISRGKLPINLLLGDDTILSSSSLKHIAPFQLVNVSFSETLKLIHFHWDGNVLKNTLLDETTPHIWSSNTLYKEEKRQHLKTQFKLHSNEFNQWNDLINFHKTVAQPLHNNVFIKKDKGLQTVSITSLKLQDETIELYYNNLLDDAQYYKKAI